MPFVAINDDGELEIRWPFWVRERFDIVVGLWFEMVELLGVLPLAPWIEAARERTIVLQRETSQPGQQVEDGGAENQVSSEPLETSTPTAPKADKDYRLG
ncbi:hypothetical protein ST47_g6830 [Ascochyta rabiei]|uniref:Uncharacterized protein n=1 Tax=Didymella rabiei TaxID=5454 RepID=A0A163BVL8_DIDRA|nr:hypothetical protein ST47_g6830 [Ascochyta rabiei]